MPYKIKGKCIYNKNTGKRLGCTKKSVQKYLKTLHANVKEDSMKLVDILNNMRDKRARVHYSQQLIEKIEEAFDFNNIEIGKIQKFSNTSYYFEIIIDENETDVYVDFIPTKPERVKLFPLIQNADTIYNVAFSIGDEGITTQYQKTNIKTYLKILKTVSSCVKIFISDNNPDVLIFRATGKRDKDDIDLQKMNIYRAICDKHLPNNYSIENTSFPDGKEGFLAFNRTKFIRKDSQ